MEIQVSFLSGLWIDLSCPAIDWPIFSAELENWESVSHIAIRETNATVWTVLQPAELTGTI
jgi:hypothetical protein